MGEFMTMSEAGFPGDIEFRLEKNGAVVQNGNSKNLIFSFDHIISHVSKFITLKTGDVIFTGTPTGVGPVAPEDLLEGFLAGKKVLTVRVK